MRPILLACLVLACDAGTDHRTATASVAPSKPTTESVALSPSVSETQDATSPTTSAAATNPAPAARTGAVAAPVAAPPFDVATLRELHAFDGRLTSEVLLDDAWSPPKGLAMLRKTHIETDGITKKVDPETRGIPAGYHEGDAWVVLTRAGPELGKVTGLGFPAGDGEPVAWLIFRDEPNRAAFGLAWPGAVVPEGLTMQPAPAALEPPDAATFAQILESLADSTDAKAMLERHPPKAEHAVVIRGNFANGHTRLVVLSTPTPAAADPKSPQMNGAWTLADPAGPGERITKVFATGRGTPLVLHSVVDWNGDATQDALVFTETYEDEFTTTTSIVWWQDSKPRQRAIAQG